MDSFLFQFLQSKLRGARKKREAQGKVARTVIATFKKKKIKQWCHERGQV